MHLKDAEALGYTYDAADASFELLLREELEGQRRSYFDVESWRSEVGEGRGGAQAEATVKVHTPSGRIVRTGEGNGPVNALDQALRKDIGKFQAETQVLDEHIGFA